MATPNVLKRSLTKLNYHFAYYSRTTKWSVTIKIPQFAYLIMRFKIPDPLTTSLYHVPGFIHSFQKPLIQPPDKYLVKRPILACLVIPEISPYNNNYNNSNWDDTTQTYESCKLADGHIFLWTFCCRYDLYFEIRQSADAYIVCCSK